MSRGDVAEEAQARRPRTQRRDEDHDDVYWECSRPGCLYYSKTPARRDEHERLCTGGAEIPFRR